MSQETTKGLIVAIDGPSGAGKSTVTRQLAERLGYVHIDTGAMFRAVALQIKRSGIDPDDERAIERLLEQIAISFCRKGGGCRVLINGEDVSAEIRTPEISLLSAKIAANRLVREFLLRQQRAMGKNGGVVLEGRDIGTVVFPEAQVKFFLSASAEERGRRRFLELQAKGEAVTLERTIAEVVKRDEQDRNREHAPLRRADDAIDIDSTTMSVAEVVAQMDGIVREKLAQCNSGQE